MTVEPPDAPAAHEIARAYMATWNATGEDTCRALLEEHWAPDVSYVDPLAAVTGYAGVHAVVTGVHEQFPDFEFVLLGDVDAHHDQMRFRWGLGPVGSEPVIVGFDVVVLDHDGRIADVRGFLDRVPG